MKHQKNNSKNIVTNFPPIQIISTYILDDVQAMPHSAPLFESYKETSIWKIDDNHFMSTPQTSKI